MNMIVGVDFDNTIVNYADIMHKTALRWGYIDVDTPKNKQEIREAIRQLKDGETAWQRLQAFVYAEAMEEAALFEGVRDFFRACQERSIPLYIVSHKTKTVDIVEAQEYGSDLWGPTFRWMEHRGFFVKNGMGFSQDRVYFEPTRGKKIERMKELGCTHFIDDLEEFFSEESFPNSVEKILFGASQKYSSSTDVKVFSTWPEIHGYFFTEADVVVARHTGMAKNHDGVPSKE